MSHGIYIQVPFCQSKCTYCNFHTGVFSNSLYGPYAAAVCRELHEYATLYEAAGIASGLGSSSVADTVYVGGGTPSLLDPAVLGRILNAIRTSFTCAWEEVTLEADPETITPQKASAWLAAGFNRISLGAQSFNDAELKAAGRMHRSADIARANQILREAGFSNLSFDLIAGLPHQTHASWRASVDELLSLRPEHISIYLMEIDEGSRLGREVIQLGTRYSAPALPADDDMAAFYEFACDVLAAAGYEHYEISNWALPGRHSRHNLKYWRREPYLGFGAGAHSFNGRERWANAHDPGTYVAAMEQGRLPIEQHEELTPQQSLDEELFLGLRQLEGIDVASIERRYNVELAPRLAGLRESGLVELNGSRARLSPARLAVSNEVFVALLG